LASPSVTGWSDQHVHVCEVKLVDYHYQSVDWMIDESDGRTEGCAMPMKSPPHPGLSVRHDCLEPLGLSVAEAAQKLGVSRKQLSDVVNGHSGISPEMAIRLDKSFGGGTATWYRLQAAYDVAQAMEQADRINVERLAPAGVE
jgi:addiction module HigA family antidote